MVVVVAEAVGECILLAADPVAELICVAWAMARVAELEAENSTALRI